MFKIGTNPEGGQYTRVYDITLDLVGIFEEGYFMSLPTIPDIDPKITLDRCDAIHLLISSIALEEIGLSHILNAEGEKLQSFLEHSCNDLDAYLNINDSINKTLRSIVSSQILLNFKLDSALLLDEHSKCHTCSPSKKKPCDKKPPKTKPCHHDPCHKEPCDKEPPKKKPCKDDLCDKKPCKHDPCINWDEMKCLCYCPNERKKEDCKEKKHTETKEYCPKCKKEQKHCDCTKRKNY